MPQYQVVAFIKRPLPSHKKDPFFLFFLFVCLVFLCPLTELGSLEGMWMLNVLFAQATERQFRCLDVSRGSSFSREQSLGDLGAQNCRKQALYQVCTDRVVLTWAVNFQVHRQGHLVSSHYPGVWSTASSKSTRTSSSASFESDFEEVPLCSWHTGGVSVSVFSLRCTWLLARIC